MPSGPGSKFSVKSPRMMGLRPRPVGVLGWTSQTISNFPFRRSARLIGLREALIPRSKFTCTLFTDIHDMLGVPRLPLFRSGKNKTNENIGNVTRNLEQQHVEKLFARLQV